MTPATAGHLAADHVPAQLPGGWRVARLSDVCELNPRRPNLNGRADDAPTTFVPMQAVGEREGAIIAAELRPFREIANGYTYFAEGDVLFAKITPCMQNGKHAIARGLTDGIGFGSTEFHVIRPGPDIIAEWVWHYVRQPRVLRDATRYFTGAVGQQRVPDDFLARLRIPLPPLAEQRRIVAVLSEKLAAVEKASAAAAERLRLAKALPACALRAVFSGDEAKTWPVKRLGDCAEVVSGITLGRKLRQGPVRRVPYLRVANVKDGYLDLADVYEIEATEAEIEKLRLCRGDLLLTEGGDRDKLGRGTFWEDQLPECLHQNHIFRVRLPAERFVPAFVAAQFGSPYGKAYFLRHAKQTTGIACINQRVLRGFPLMIPSREAQLRVAKTLQQDAAVVQRIIDAATEELDGLGSLRSSLLRRAFAGGL